MVDIEQWQIKFHDFIADTDNADSAHDLQHIARVVKNAVRFAEIEQAKMEVVIPAAWLHDCVVVAKNSPQRNQASLLAAEKAVNFLSQEHYPSEYLPEIHHAIHAHSFSANIPPQTIEAKVLQDADRIDAIGAVGIARCFIVGGQFQCPIYSVDDPFCKSREPNDKAYIVDHFYEKLLKLQGTMQTSAGRREAQARHDFMKLYLQQLEDEI